MGAALQHSAADDLHILCHIGLISISVEKHDRLMIMTLVGLILLVMLTLVYIFSYNHDVRFGHQKRDRHELAGAVYAAVRPTAFSPLGHLPFHFAWPVAAVIGGAQYWQYARAVPHNTMYEVRPHLNGTIDVEPRDVPATKP